MNKHMLLPMGLITDVLFLPFSETCFYCCPYYCSWQLALRIKNNNNNRSILPLAWSWHSDHTCFNVKAKIWLKKWVMNYFSPGSFCMIINSDLYRYCFKLKLQSCYGKWRKQKVYTGSGLEKCVLFFGCAISNQMELPLMDKHLLLVIDVILFWSTASALPSSGAGGPEWLFVHAAPSGLHFFTAPLQRKRRPFPWTGPGHLLRCSKENHKTLHVSLPSGYRSVMLSEKLWDLASDQKVLQLLPYLSDDCFKLHSHDALYTKVSLHIEMIILCLS